MKVLIANNQPDFIVQLKDYCQTRGDAITTADNSKQAWSIYRLSPEKYDLILIVHRMPEVGGVEFIKQVHKNGLAVPIVVMSDNFKSFNDIEINNEMVEYLPTTVGLATLEKTFTRIESNFAQEKSVLPENAPELLQQSPALSPALSPTLSPATADSPRILVVDDEPLIRDVLCEILEMEAYQTEQAANGIEALEKWQQQAESSTPYDLLLVDLTMPLMDGAALLEKIRKTDSMLPVIILTGHAKLNEAYSLLKEYRISDFLTKPLVNSERLLFTVKNALKQSQLYRELKILNAELEQEKKKLIQANQSKSIFLSRMSHELRSPLNSVIGFSEILISEISDERQLQYAHSIHNAGGHLLSLIGDILDVSKIEAGALTLESVSFELQTLCEQVHSLIHARAHKKSIDFSISCADDVPRYLKGDPTRLSQILINLADNAIKFTHQGSVQIHIKNLGQQPHDPQLKFSVTDTGIGIAEDKLGTLFEAFTQAESVTSRQYGGTGLGLNICQQLVKAMGGEIGINSAPGQGSCFWFRLPLTAGKANAAVKVEKDLVVIKPLSILVAEDVELNVMLVKAMLESDGHQIVAAKDGQEALEAVQHQHFDLVLMDAHMPRMDGIEATRRIRALKDPQIAKIPIIALSADVIKDQQERFYQAGINASIGKPFKRDQLRQAIAAISGAKPILEQVVEESPDILLVDYKYLDQLTNSVGEDSLTSLLEQFEINSCEQMQLLNQAGKQGDLNEIRRTAHGLTGMAANLGLNRLYLTCGQLQKSANETPLADLAQLIIEAEQTLLKSIQALQEIHPYPSPVSG